MLLFFYLFLSFLFFFLTICNSKNYQSKVYQLDPILSTETYPIRYNRITLTTEIASSNVKTRNTCHYTYTLTKFKNELNNIRVLFQYNIYIIDKFF